eukprot:TRINITY_DN17113_c0_g1_i1.p4 TRINITY_DN17113_c0_g1~~TRINITY_DN17113_c0_g1_i1.p4  ORF type:complete len:83 (+),score=14.12 TRINITY_DN17113_c0_g1_i1:217-465(+)
MKFLFRELLKLFDCSPLLYDELLLFEEELCVLVLPAASDIDLAKLFNAERKFGMEGEDGAETGLGAIGEKFEDGAIMLFAIA